MALRVRDLRLDERAWVQALLSARWHGPRIVTRGVVHEATTLPGVVAERHGERVGLATYRIADGACELITLDALEPRRGIGRALLEAVQTRARARAATRLWLVTTNDNQPAIDFYTHCGLAQVAIHRGAASLARRLKPSIPEVAPNGIPIEDEVEYEVRL